MKFLIGLLLGIAIAGGAAYYLNKAQTPFVDKGIAVDNQANAKANSSTPLLLAPGTKMQQATSTPPHAKASSPTYDFYDVLQGKKAIATPESTSDSEKTDEHHGYLVQAGAFNDPDLANNMKARLALLGYSAKITTEQTDTKIINKVVLGPYHSASEANQLVNELNQQQISATVIDLTQ